MKTGVRLILVIGALGIGLASAPPAAARDRSNRCSAVRVYGVQPSGEVASRPGWRFSVRRVDALEFHVRLPARLAGSHRVELKLYTPQGDLYQTLATTHANPRIESGSAQERRRARRRRAPATLRLPVAATTIVRSSLYGRWRVEAHLDGASEPCSRPRRFRIKP